MRKQYLSAPLPFVGQKRMFAKQYIKVLSQYPNDATFVDLFGGSGLLSHLTKCQKPEAKVIYNDYDDYRKRLAAIPYTNMILENIREIVKGIPKGKIINGNTRNMIKEAETKYRYIDYVTLSTSLLFSMKYKDNLQDLQKETIYNKVRKTNYPLCTDYLEGLEITSCDYKELYQKYKDTPNVVFSVDPPYLCTEVGTYKMNWRLSDYLDILTVIANNNFVYFTSNKSSIIELCEWIGKNRSIGNPFINCNKIIFNAQMNYQATYQDIMLYTNRREQRSLIA